MPDQGESQDQEDSARNIHGGYRIESNTPKEVREISKSQRHRRDATGHRQGGHAGIMMEIVRRHSRQDILGPEDSQEPRARVI